MTSFFPRPRSALVCFCLAAAAFARGTGDGSVNRFVYAQLRYDGAWDPYPGAWESVSPLLARWTSLEPWPERRVVRGTDDALFDGPFLAVLGRGPLVLKAAELERLRFYMRGGGFVFFDNSEGDRNSPFARDVRALPQKLFPGAVWSRIPADDALFRAFFLLRRAAGRRRADDALWGLTLQNRLVAVFAPNDFHGAAVLDAAGTPLYHCEPDGEAQRLETKKWLVNVLIYSVTGTYKTDAIHQPFIERKLKE